MKLFCQLVLIGFLFALVSCDNDDENSSKKKLYLKSADIIQGDMHGTTEHAYNDQHLVVSSETSTYFNDDEYSTKMEYEYDAKDRILYSHLSTNGEKYRSDSMIYNDKNQIIKEQNIWYRNAKSGIDFSKFIWLDKAIKNKLKSSSDFLYTLYTLNEYNTKGLKIKSISYYNDSSISQYVIYEYDANGNMIYEKAYGRVADIENLPDYYEEIITTYNDKNAPGKNMNMYELYYPQNNCPTKATLNRYNYDGSIETTTAVYSYKYNSDNYPIELTLTVEGEEEDIPVVSTMTYIE